MSGGKYLQQHGLKSLGKIALLTVLCAAASGLAVLLTGRHLPGVFAPLSAQAVQASPPVSRQAPMNETARYVKKFDEVGRYTFVGDRREVACPKQTRDMAVLLAIGQSNSANFSPAKVPTKYPGKVLNFFEGKCYQARAPLLGATGDSGEFLSPLSDLLIESRAYKTVVIVAGGVGGTPIARWKKNGDLNNLLLKTVSRLKRTHNPTHIVWHQGETDFSNNTPTAIYISSFLSLQRSLSEVGVSAPFFISVSTQCNQPNWSFKSPTSDAQYQLVGRDNVFLGANTDVLLSRADRSDDNCHFNERGLRKTARAYAEAILKARQAR